MEFEEQPLKKKTVEANPNSQEEFETVYAMYTIFRHK